MNLKLFVILICAVAVKSRRGNRLRKYVSHQRKNNKKSPLRRFNTASAMKSRLLLNLADFKSGSIRNFLTLFPEFIKTDPTGQPSPNPINHFNAVHKRLCNVQMCNKCDIIIGRRLNHAIRPCLHLLSLSNCCNNNRMMSSF